MSILSLDRIFSKLIDIKDTAAAKKERNEIIRYAIIAEAKANNDLASIICRAKAKTTGQIQPAIFNEFSTDTADILLAIGIPANIIFNDKNLPNESSIESMDKIKVSSNTFETKTASELYEFYIRKCKLLKSLYKSNSLSILSVNLHSRCKNIELATRILIVKCTEKKKKKD
jgi:hypothetical protein